MITPFDMFQNDAEHAVREYCASVERDSHIDHHLGGSLQLELAS